MVQNFSISPGKIVFVECNLSRSEPLLSDLISAIKDEKWLLEKIERCDAAPCLSFARKYWSCRMELFVVYTLQIDMT